MSQSYIARLMQCCCILPDDKKDITKEEIADIKNIAQPIDKNIHTIGDKQIAINDNFI